MIPVEKSPPRVKALALATTLVPAAVFILVLRGPVIAVAEKRQARLAELAALRQNTYREGWFDSAEAELRQDVENLRGLRNRALAALAFEAESGPDPLRRAAQSLGCEVLRISPSRDSAGGLARLRLRFEMRSDFASALRFFRALRLQHPEAYPEEMLLRRSGNSGSKLDLGLTLLIHLAPGEKP